MKMIEERKKDAPQRGVRSSEWPGECVYVPQEDAAELRSGREVYTSVTPYPRRDENDERRTRYTRIESLWHDPVEAGEWAECKPLLLRIRFAAEGGSRGRCCYTVGTWSKENGFHCNKLTKMQNIYPGSKVESFAVCFELW